MNSDTRSCATTIVQPSSKSVCRSRPVPLAAVELTDGFWRQKVAGVASSTIAKIDAMNEASGRYENFRVVGGQSQAAVKGLYFNDSDVYKWLEAAAWSLVHYPDGALERHIDEVVDLLRTAQLDDGYLNTYYQGNDVSQRWSAFRHHEMYCAGHLIQAAVAHHRVTGDRNLLGVATRFADHICSQFAADRNTGVDTHPEIEMALVELYRETGDRRYLEQARYFVDARGKHDIDVIPGPAFDQEYHQNRVPLREMQRMEGHVVRMLYLCSGAADVVAETGDEELHRVLRVLWDNMASAHLYVTGGLGARCETEGFGDDFVLPNSHAYAETCAAVASIMWNWRMLLLDNDRKFSDLLELTLYNAMLAGISCDGEKFFYVNPLENDGSHRRQDWFECACCPSNIARTLAALPAYLYSVAGDQLFVHLYDSNEAAIELGNGTAVRIAMTTNYPWEGEIAITVRDAGEFALCLRIPAWAGDDWQAGVNGEAIADWTLDKGYLVVHRSWQSGDSLVLTLPLPIRVLEAHPAVQENLGKVALTRGPLVYCFEGEDNPQVDVADLCLATGQPVNSTGHTGVDELVRLQAQGRERALADGWQGQLYRVLGEAKFPRAGNLRTVTALPYFAWANRSNCAMRVWLPACTE